MLHRPNRPNWLSLTGEQRLAIIKPEWLDGASAAEIATYCFSNATRKKVIGYVHRAKLQRAISNKPAKNHQRPKKPKTKNLDRVVSTAPKPTAPRQYFDALNQERDPLPGTVPIGILDLPNRRGVRCRFMVRGGYCGQDSGEHTYCEAHRAIAYRPDETVRRKK